MLCLQYNELPGQCDKVLPWTDLDQDPSPTFTYSKAKLQCHLGYICTVNTQGTVPKPKPWDISRDCVRQSHQDLAAQGLQETDLIEGWQVQWKASVPIMQTHRTHKNVTHETVEEEARKEVWKQSELEVYIDMFNNYLHL